MEEEDYVQKTIRSFLEVLKFRTRTG